MNLAQFALKEQIESEKRISIQDPMARSLGIPKDKGFMGGLPRSVVVGRTIPSLVAGRDQR